jgi:transcriptional regulator with XRE-family HTH domain
MQTFRNRVADVGNRRARDQANRFGRELRIARTVVGMTQAQLASRAALSQQEVSRAESGDVGVSFEARCRMAAACGHEVALKLFPVATVSLRDSGQLSLANALLRVLHPIWHPRIEVPVAAGDLRAADMLLSHPDELVQIEIERALVDFQAQLRSGQLKREVLAAGESRPVRLVLAIPDSHNARERLRSIAGLLERSLPMDTRGVLAALRNGRAVGSDGLVLIRESRLTRPASTSAASAP